MCATSGRSSSESSKMSGMELVGEMDLTGEGDRIFMS